MVSYLAYNFEVELLIYQDILRL